MPHCPLCLNRNTTCVESLSVLHLNELYARALGVINAVKSKSLDYYSCLQCRLGFFHPMEVGEEDLYEQLQKNDWYYMDEKEEYRIALGYMKDINSILEVGAGKAAFVAYVGKQRYTGLEFNDAAINRAAHSGITLYKQTVEEHVRDGTRYGAVVSFQVLEHVAQPGEFIQGCVDCLDPGGRLVISVPSRDGFVGLTSNNILDMPPHHITHWSEHTLRKVADLYGLRCLDIQHEQVADYHREWAKVVLRQSRIQKLFGINFRLLDRRSVFRLVQKIEAKSRSFIDPSLNGIKGHTVVAIYEKPASKYK